MPQLKNQVTHTFNFTSSTFEVTDLNFEINFDKVGLNAAYNICGFLSFIWIARSKYYFSSETKLNHLIEMHKLQLPT